jgi:NADH-quinone oxidoreductase subunit N
MAASVKAAAFTGFLRVWLEAFQGTGDAWHGAIWWLAVATMLVGNLVALAQKNIKRMLAYSSIAHAGYILVALATGTPAASAAFLFYLFAYTLATFGAFGVIVALERHGGSRLAIDDYSGLWSASPGLASAMAVFMLALLGFPIFGGIGFFAKYWIIQSALQAPSPQTMLSVILVITSLISAGYYMYVVMVMFMRPRAPDAPPVTAPSGWTRTVIAGAAILILVLGVFPSSVIRWTERSGTRPPAAVEPESGVTTASVGP